MSEKWRLVVGVPVLKRGNRSIYNCVIIEAHHWSIWHRVRAKFITERLSKTVDSVVLEEETCFENEKSCMGNIFGINQIIEEQQEDERNSSPICRLHESI